MKTYNTFGEFILWKRQECGYTGRELAKKTNISAVYLCEIEKGSKCAISDTILENLITALQLNEFETELIYDLLAKAQNSVSIDLPEYIMEKDIVRAALRTAKKNNVTDKQWEDFIKRITTQNK